MWTCPGDSSHSVSYCGFVFKHSVMKSSSMRCIILQSRYTSQLRYSIASKPALTRWQLPCFRKQQSFFNSLDDSALVSRTSLSSIVTRPTRGANILDRIYVNDLSYATVKVVTSTDRSDHKTIIAYAAVLFQLWFFNFSFSYSCD